MAERDDPSQVNNDAKDEEKPREEWSRLDDNRGAFHEPERGSTNGPGAPGGACTSTRSSRRAVESTLSSISTLCTVSAVPSVPTQSGSGHGDLLYVRIRSTGIWRRQHGWRRRGREFPWAGRRRGGGAGGSSSSGGPSGSSATSPYAVSPLSLPPLGTLYQGTGTFPDNRTMVDPASVPGLAKLAFFTQSLKLTTMLFQINQPVVPNWFGVAIPNNSVNFDRPNLFFHPIPAQAGYLDGDYQTKTGKWPELYYYMERLGYR